VTLGEFELIERWFSRPARRDDVLLGVGDDAALLRVPAGSALVAATDTLVEGVHFLPDAPADSVGHQALAVNLSDLAAMGAQPAWALLSLSLPVADDAWLALSPPVCTRLPRARASPWSAATRCEVRS
jgi:thiamine-monophosphate kinase